MQTKRYRATMPSYLKILKCKSKKGEACASPEQSACLWKKPPTPVKHDYGFIMSVKLRFFLEEIMIKIPPRAIKRTTHEHQVFKSPLPWLFDFHLLLNSCWGLKEKESLSNHNRYQFLQLSLPLQFRNRQNQVLFQEFDSCMDS